MVRTFKLLNCATSSCDQRCLSLKDFIITALIGLFVLEYILQMLLSVTTKSRQADVFGELVLVYRDKWKSKAVKNIMTGI